MKDFFVSYNGADRAWAEWIAWVLEAAGYSTVIQAWDFRPGGDFILEMQEAARKTERTIMVLSPDYLTALYTQPEWAAAFAKDPTGALCALVPVRVRECAPDGMLMTRIFIDLVGLDEAAAEEKLLAGVREGRVKPELRPAFQGASISAGPTPERSSFPGTLPPIWNIPHRRNPNFTGRAALLEDLRTALTSGRPAALTQAISGLGGVGKTQLALEYVYRHAADYELVWWVRAEEPATLAADLAALAVPLNLPEQDNPDQPAIVEAVLRRLSERSDWLLIFDNANSVQDLHDYLPRITAGHLLITSRDPNWKSVAEPLPLRVLERSESVDFLLKRTGSSDHAGAEALARELGDLPLALEQAGAYVEETSTSIAGYLDLFRTRRAELWNDERGPDDHRETVAATWSLAMEKIAEESPAAAGLLGVLAFLEPDNIPRDLLDGAVDDPLERGRAIKALRRYSLIEADEHFISVHRLVQAVMRDRLTEEEGGNLLKLALRLVNDAFPFESDDVRTWTVCASLLPHALAVTAYAEESGIAGDLTARLLNQATLYLQGRVELRTANNLVRRALAIKEASHGPDHPDVAKTLNNLGLVLRTQGDLTGARMHYELALKINETNHGPDHPEVATSLNNLGDVLRAQGDLSEARTCFERALKIDEASHGPDHPDVATDLNNFGQVLRVQGDLSGARAHYERSLKINEANYGPDHPEVATSLNNLGDVLRAQGDLSEARTCLERSLKINEASYGADHPRVATNLSNLGQVLYAQGDLTGARAHFERALKINEASYGADHPDVATALSNLGMDLRVQGDLTGARARFERALKINEASYGADHPRVATNLNNLGGILRVQGDLTGARAHFERALKIDEASYGLEHPKIGPDVSNLGFLLYQQGDFAGARKCYERALAIFSKFFGTDHEYTRRTRDSLAALDGLLPGSKS